MLEPLQAGEVEKVTARLMKFTLPHLHELMDVLDLPRGDGTKVCSPFSTVLSMVLVKGM